MSTYVDLAWYIGMDASHMSVETQLSYVICIHIYLYTIHIHALIYVCASSGNFFLLWWCLAPSVPDWNPQLRMSHERPCGCINRWQRLPACFHYGISILVHVKMIITNSHHQRCCGSEDRRSQYAWAKWVRHRHCPLCFPQNDERSRFESLSTGRIKSRC